MYAGIFAGGNSTLAVLIWMHFCKNGEREELDVPEWVLERINELLTRIGMYPFPRKTTSTEDDSCRGDGGGDSAGL